jgi:hypothetical protein
MRRRAYLREIAGRYDGNAASVAAALVENEAATTTRSFFVVLCLATRANAESVAELGNGHDGFAVCRDGVTINGFHAHLIHHRLE